MVRWVRGQRRRAPGREYPPRRGRGGPRRPPRYGTAAVFRGWDWASIYGLYERASFPSQKLPVDRPVPVAAGMAGSEHLWIIRESSPAVLDEVRPDLVAYNSGRVWYRGDPFARCRL